MMSANLVLGSYPSLSLLELTARLAGNSSWPLIQTRVGGGDITTETRARAQNTQPSSPTIRIVSNNRSSGDVKDPSFSSQSASPGCCNLSGDATATKTKEGCCAQSLHRPCVKPMMTLPRRPRSVRCRVWCGCGPWPGQAGMTAARPDPYTKGGMMISLLSCSCPPGRRGLIPLIPFLFVVSDAFTRGRGGTGKDVLGWGARAMRAGGHA